MPEIPRWSFIHGKEEEGERIVKQIESEIESETGKSLDRSNPHGVRDGGVLLRLGGCQLGLSDGI